MAGEISKQEQSLVKGAGYVRDAKTDLDAELAGLRGQLAGIGAQWRGGGASAFTSVMTRWDENTKKITSALNGFEENLRGSETTYNANDEDQAGTYSRLSGRLG